MSGIGMMNRLKFRNVRLNLGVREKLLLPIVGTLILVIVGLSITLVSLQQRLNRKKIFNR